MSDQAQSNYLKNTIPEFEEEFVEIIGQIPLFSGLSSDMLYQLFQYSKFIQLEDGQYIIHEGQYDQEIFILLQGSVRVLLLNKEGKEELIDVMKEQFTLFGERSFLGEPRGATIAADGDVLLLGIDLSPLPDIQDVMDTPDSRLEDHMYLQNVNMYTMFATVLAQRFDRLVRDQIKLQRKIKNFQKRQKSWTEDWLHARIFNQMVSDQLPEDHNLKKLFKAFLKKYSIHSPRMTQIMKNPILSTKQLYGELIRLEALGEIDDLPDALIYLVFNLGSLLKTHKQYVDLFEIDFVLIQGFRKIQTPIDYLNKLYETISHAGILAGTLSQSQFINAFLIDGCLNPSEFANFLKKNGSVISHFDLSHIMFLICQHCLDIISEVNHIIRDFTQFFLMYCSAHQDLRSFQVQGSTLVERLSFMQRQQDRSVQSITEKPEMESSQDRVEDLLSEFGL